MRATTPARNAYFDSLQLDLRPTVTDARANDQFWIVGGGAFEGRTLLVGDASSTYGTAFGAGFDATRVQYADWGTPRLRFTSSSSAVLEFEANDLRFGSGEYTLSRVASPAQRRCEQQGFADTTSNERTVGAWFNNVNRSGEGVLIEVLEGDLGFAAWFNYGRLR